MKENKKWYWENKNQQQVIIFITWTIVHTCLELVTVKYVHNIPRSVYSRNQQKQALQRNPSCLTDYDQNYILEKIERRDNIE